MLSWDTKLWLIWVLFQLLKWGILKDGIQTQLCWQSFAMSYFLAVAFIQNPRICGDCSPSFLWHPRPWEALDSFGMLTLWCYGKGVGNAIPRIPQSRHYRTDVSSVQPLHIFLSVFYSPWLLEEELSLVDWRPDGLRTYTPCFCLPCYDSEASDV